MSYIQLGYETPGVLVNVKVNDRIISIVSWEGGRRKSMMLAAAFG